MASPTDSPSRDNRALAIRAEWSHSDVGPVFNVGTPSLLPGAPVLGVGLFR